MHEWLSRYRGKRGIQAIAGAAGGAVLLGLVACGAEAPADGPAAQPSKREQWRQYSGALADGSQGREGGLRVIEVQQTACQFLEAEHYVEQNFSARSAQQCHEINARTWAARARNARPLLAMQGEFIIRVSNRDVPYPVDFWLRPYENHFTTAQPRIELPEYRIEEIPPGETREIRVDLPRSFYLWSSPRNGTPDYSLLIYDMAAHW